MKFSSRGFLFCLSAAALVLAGCKRTFGPGGTANCTWNDGGPVAGLDHATISCGLLSNGQTVVVFWSDLSGASAVTDAGGSVWKANYRTPDGRALECRCESADGIAGHVAIDDKSFDLAQGHLFLISTSGPKSRIQQLRVDPVKLNVDTVKSLAASNAEIQKFFKTPAP